MMGRPITEDLAREVLAEPASETPPAPAAVLEHAEPASLQGLSPGRSYLIEEDRPVEAFRRFAAFLGGRGGGLVITRTNPKRVRETYELPAERVLWLTDREGSAEDTIAPALERIVYEIEDAISESHYALIISLGSATVKEQELKVLEREMEVIRIP